MEAATAVVIRAVVGAASLTAEAVSSHIGSNIAQFTAILPVPPSNTSLPEPYASSQSQCANYSSSLGTTTQSSGADLLLHLPPHHLTHPARRNRRMCGAPLPTTGPSWRSTAPPVNSDAFEMRASQHVEPGSYPRSAFVIKTDSFRGCLDCL